MLKSGDQNVMLLTLSSQEGKVKGTLVRPEHFTVNGEGDFSEIKAPLVEHPVEGERTPSGAVRVVEGESSDPLEMEITFPSASRAEVRVDGMPSWMSPWNFERATERTQMEVGKQWSEERPHSPAVSAEAANLLKLAEEDQAVRSGTISMQAVDRLAAKHKPEILRIHKTYGWPKRSEFGPDAAHAFWQLVQHQDLKLQKRLLPELEKLSGQGEASRQDYTLLFDRVRKAQGQPQRWGNSASCKDGKAVLDPVEDPEGLAKRRAEMHLPPIGDYLKTIDEQCARIAP